MPAMAMQCLQMGKLSPSQAPAARRSRCSVRTMAIVAAPPKTGLKTEKSEKVLLRLSSIILYGLMWLPGGAP